MTTSKQPIFKEDEKLKKRLFALLMAAVMVLALTACGEGGEAPAPVTATPTPGTAATRA